MGIPVDLLRRRPDIRAAEYNAMAQGAQIGVAKAELYPALSLSGTFGFLPRTWAKSPWRACLTGRDRSGYHRARTLTWNFFNYGRITNNVRFQDAQLPDLLVTYKTPCSAPSRTSRIT